MKSDDVAARLYEQAALQHNFLAEYRLGKLYLNGSGVTQSYLKAFNWFYESAKYGYPPAEEALGNLYNLGLGTEANQEKAYAWTKLAAQNGLKSAQDKLSILKNIVSAEEIQQADTEVSSAIAKHIAAIN